MKKDDAVTVPVWNKMNLTLEEASAYTGVGVCRLRKLANAEACDFILHVGNKKLFKRKGLEEYIRKAESI